MVDREQAARVAGKAWRRYRSWRGWVQVLIALFVLSLVVSPFTSEDEDTERVAQRGTTTTVAATTTTTAPPTTTTTVADPKRQLEAALLKALGKSNRKGVRRVEVTGAEPGLPIVAKWAIDENLTEGLTKDTARLETVKILKAVRSFKGVEWAGARLEGTYSLVDQFGNAAEHRVFLGDYSRPTIERINFDGFDFKNAWEITDEEPFVHPSFRY